MKAFILLPLIVILLWSCRESSEDFALKWTKDIKAKILEDVNITIDSISTDTTGDNFKYISFYHNGIRTKKYGIRTSTGDTIVSYFFSPDQNFEIVRELCPGIQRSFEVIRYKGKHLGLAEFKFCNGQPMLRGFQFDSDIGVWKEWDSTGNLIKETNVGHIDKLEKLKEIKYPR